MDKKAFSKYIKHCRELDIPDSVSMGIIMKHHGMQKSSNYFLKQANKAGILAKLWPWLAGAIGLGAGYGGYSISSKERTNQAATIAQLKKDIKGLTGVPPISSEQLIGGAGGGGLGMLLGPQIFTSLDKPNARILGGLGGALAGAMAGTAFQKKK